MADYVILVLGIVSISSLISIAGIVSAHINKQSKLKLEVLKQEIELEKIRKESYIIETEKLRLEIEQTRLQLSLDSPTIQSSSQHFIDDKTN
ncbi:hypothetical protein [Lysinibacillus endophyticus]|uniref:Uncharacterized protein n=1 Tax=Ureibacillus endophyticus TaxID=1978490 RepID=A0A494Z0W4_9BACL|nr:hypothetical protein [Lysinibacillus endophyticus]MCP1144276.1 hypothetical protein [Lysinibacillus endophyticus]RKQ16167.1 hypothetical protein D8M03_10495 [Lysinibacillus endophyticus]